MTDMERIIIYKISPNPSFPKRGTKSVISAIIDKKIITAIWRNDEIH
jgi:hypothetical protein